MYKEQMKRNFQSNRKVFFKDIMLPKKDVENELKKYTSDYINLHEFDKKLYEDEIYSQELRLSNVIYANFKGDWVVDEYTDEYGMEILKFIDNKSGQHFELAFPDAVNKMKFATEVYTSMPIKQENPGMMIGQMASQNQLEKKNTFIDTNFIKVASIFLLSVISIGAIIKKLKK